METKPKSGITFNVANVSPSGPFPTEPATIASIIQKQNHLVHTLGGTLLLNSQSHPNTCPPEFENGFVATCLSAYNHHYPLKLSPDQVWIAITTALANYIDKHAEEMRHVFVDFDDQKELVVSGGGNIFTADYTSLISQLSDKIDEQTKGDIRTWLECDFTTSTLLSRTVSKLVLMGAMKNYFSLKMRMECGLPKVTLEGTVDDWKEIRKRVDKMSEWNVPVLTEWAKVLGYVLDHFVKAFEGTIDVDFWNGIVNYFGGSGSPTINGWILAFVPFNDAGRYVLSSITNILQHKRFGRMAICDLPPTAVEVPVTIDDNGRVYKTKFCAGALAIVLEEGDVLTPSLDWALIDVTNAKDPKDVQPITRLPLRKKHK